MMDSDKRKKRLEAVKRYAERNREKVLARRKEHYQRNKEELQKKALERYHLNRNRNIEKMRKYKEKNKEKLKLATANYRVANKEEVNKRSKAWNKANPGKKNALTAKRLSKKIQATPPWLTKLDIDLIAMFYEAAADQKQYGLDCHVDHIIPLQGREVCGLHVPWNLQVLPASENISKGNRL